MVNERYFNKKALWYDDSQAESQHEHDSCSKEGYVQLIHFLDISLLITLKQLWYTVFYKIYNHNIFKFIVQLILLQLSNFFGVIFFSI